MKILLFLSFLLICISACKQDSSFTPERLQHYVHSKDNGFSVQKTKGQFQYGFRYLPNNYRILKSMNFQLRDTVQYQRLLQETRGEHTILFQIASTKKHRTLEDIYKQKGKSIPWEDVLKILTFRSQQAFELKINNEWLPCRLYHLLPSINILDGYQFMLVFEDSNKLETSEYQEGLEFRYKDSYFSGETIHFAISQNRLNEIPQLSKDQHSDQITVRSQIQDIDLVCL